MSGRKNSEQFLIDSVESFISTGRTFVKKIQNDLENADSVLSSIADGLGNSDGETHPSVDTAVMGLESLRNRVNSEIDFYQKSKDSSAEKALRRVSTQIDMLIKNLKT